MAGATTGLQVHEFMQGIDFDQRGAILVYIDVLRLPLKMSHKISSVATDTPRRSGGVHFP
jgi:hypothetical protein